MTKGIPQYLMDEVRRLCDNPEYFVQSPYTQFLLHKDPNEDRRSAAARRAVLATLFRKAYDLGLIRQTVRNVEPVQRGRAIHAYCAVVKAIVLRDVDNAIRSLFDEIHEDYRGVALKRALKGVTLAPDSPLHAQAYALRALEHQRALIEWRAVVNQSLPKVDYLVPLPPQTYAAVAFSRFLEQFRLLREGFMAIQMKKLRFALTLLAAQFATQAALRRCFGLMAHGWAEAFMVRALLHDETYRNRRTSYWQWLISPQPVAIANQPDRLAAIERIFAKAFVHGQAALWRAYDEGVNSLGLYGSGYAPVPDAAVEVRKLYEGIGRIGMAWMLATRAPQVSYFRWLDGGGDVEPVQRLAESAVPLLDLPPAASAVALSRDRFAPVLPELVPLCCGGAGVAASLSNDPDEAIAQVRMALKANLMETGSAVALVERWDGLVEQRRRAAAPLASNDVPFTDEVWDQLMPGLLGGGDSGDGSVESVQRLEDSVDGVDGADNPLAIPENLAADGPFDAAQVGDTREGAMPVYGHENANTGHMHQMHTSQAEENDMGTEEDVIKVWDVEDAPDWIKRLLGGNGGAE